MGDQGKKFWKIRNEADMEQAEMLLYESMDSKTADNLLKGYSFYQYLCQKDDQFLEAHDYNRSMIADGVRRLAALFGAGHLADLFLTE